MIAETLQTTIGALVFFTALFVGLLCVGLLVLVFFTGEDEIHF